MAHEISLKMLTDDRHLNKCCDFQTFFVPIITPKGSIKFRSKLHPGGSYLRGKLLRNRNLYSDPSAQREGRASCLCRPMHPEMYNNWLVRLIHMNVFCLDSHGRLTLWASLR